MRNLIIAVEGLRILFAQRMRAFFMMTGTVLGIAALIVIMAVGRGTERKVMQRVNNFGPRAMMLIAGGGRDLPPPDMTVATLKFEDARAVRENIEGLETVTPMAWRLRMNLKRQANQVRSVVWGVEPDWHQAYDWYVTEGRGIEARDVAALARVCLIGISVRKELFGDENPLGQRIYVNKVGLTVKGVLAERGISPGGRDFDNRIILPITTAMRRVMNVDYLGAIRIISADPALMPEQARAIRELISRSHHITPPEEDDFRIITPMIIAEIARGISRTLYILLITLAALSLLVGGVVMMNILLISVGARGKEIGLRRALGAKQRDIFLQFITESLCVTFLGMIGGGVLGWCGCLFLALTTMTPVLLSWPPYVVAVVFALLVGTFFGVQPARKAARLDPVEALR
ncbi:MAG: ABC transporter permease [Gemmatimonadota bacterium]|nr:ABC transporter permease [Gemmatimonadota bacterium]